MAAHRPAHADQPASRPEVRIYLLGSEPGDDLSATTTPEERVALVWELSHRMWALSGHATLAGPRDCLPIRVIRPS